jgi:hypothetical protein
MGQMRIACLPAILIILGTSLQAAGEVGPTLKLVGSSSYRPGIPVLIRLEVHAADGTMARDLWDADAALTATAGGSPVSLSPAAITLRNGLGSELVAIGSVPEGQDVQIDVTVGNLQGGRTLKNIAAVTPTTAQGTLTAAVTEWSGVVHVTGALTVPAGKTLHVQPGTLVLIDGVATDAAGLSISVAGTIDSAGTEDEPVTFTAANPAVPWGEISHTGAATSTYTYTLINKGGNSTPGGHTNTGPIVRLNGPKVVFQSSSLTDTKGKTMLASNSTLEFHDCLLARSVMGPEIDGTALVFERSWSMDMHGTDDNDAIYLHGQKTGQVIAIRDSVFALCDDDGIDTLGSTITVEDCILRDFHGLDQDAKGISVLQGEVDVKGCLLVDNLVGISAKGNGTTGATVRIDNTTVIGTDRVSPKGPQIGVQAQDKYGLPDLRILIFVSNSIIRAPIAVHTDYPKFPDDLRIKYSDLSSPWPGQFNVFDITDDPLFVDAAGNDYHLQSTSPCIDTGDPASAADPDGSRADMGAFPFTHGTPPPPAFRRGLVNADAALDISDPLALLFHLFDGQPIPCQEAADANDDASLDVSDVVLLLDFLFLDGPGPAAPAASCAADPSPDELGCDSPVCP